MSHAFNPRVYWLCLLLPCLTACGVVAPAATATATAPFMPITPSPACYLKPMATGEKIVRATVEATPPAQARRGRSISLRFSGGYVAVNNSRICGMEVVGYVHDDELPTPQVIRRVSVQLNNQVLAKSDDCPQECLIQFVIPADTPPGHYELTLVTSWAEVTRFDLEVVGD